MPVTVLMLLIVSSFLQKDYLVYFQVIKKQRTLFQKVVNIYYQSANLDQIVFFPK